MLVTHGALVTYVLADIWTDQKFEWHLCFLGAAGVCDENIVNEEEIEE